MKEIYFDFNHNHKLSCSTFLHIGLAQKKGSLNEKNEPVKIIVKNEKEHISIYARQIYMHQTTLESITDIYTYASHAMSSDDFKEWYMLKYPGIGSNAFIGIYVYQKINEKQALELEQLYHNSENEQVLPASAYKLTDNSISGSSMHSRFTPFLLI